MKKQLRFAACCVECLLKRSICKRGKSDHQFNVVPVVSFASTTVLLRRYICNELLSNENDIIWKDYYFFGHTGQRGPIVVRFALRFFKITKRSVVSAATSQNGMLRGAVLLLENDAILFLK